MESTIASLMNPTATGGNVSLLPSVNLPMFEDNATRGTNLDTDTPTTWLEYVSNISVPVLLLVGIVGNTLTLIIARSKLYRYSSHGIYLTALVIADVTFLLTFPFNKKIMISLLGRDVRALSVIGCKVHHCIFRAAKMCSSWFVVLVCFERFISVWFPFKARSFSTRKMAAASVCTVSVFILIFCGLRSITSGVKNGICLPAVLEVRNMLLIKAFSYSGMVIRSFLPTVILLTLTPMTVWKLYSQRALRRHLQSSNSCNNNDETVRTSLMLLSVVIAYIVLITPFCVTQHVLLLSGIDIVTSSLNWARDLREVTQIFEQLNAVINFIIYVLVNSSVRRYFYSFFKKCHADKHVSVSTEVLSFGSSS